MSGQRFEFILIPLLSPGRPVLDDGPLAPADRVTGQSWVNCKHISGSSCTALHCSCCSALTSMDFCMLLLNESCYLLQSYLKLVFSLVKVKFSIQIIQLMLLALVRRSFSSWRRDRSRVSSFSTAFSTANWIPNGPWFGSGPVKTLCQGVIVFPRSPMSLTSSAHPWKWFPCSQQKLVDICSMHQMPDVFWGTTCASQQKSVTWNLSTESPSLLLVHPVEPWFPYGTPQLRAM